MDKNVISFTFPFKKVKKYLFAINKFTKSSPGHIYSCFVFNFRDEFLEILSGDGECFCSVVLDDIKCGFNHSIAIPAGIILNILNFTSGDFDIFLSKDNYGIKIVQNNNVYFIEGLDPECFPEINKININNNLITGDIYKYLDIASKSCSKDSWDTRMALRCLVIKKHKNGIMFGSTDSRKMSRVFNENITIDKISEGGSLIKFEILKKVIEIIKDGFLEDEFGIGFENIGQINIGKISVCFPVICSPIFSIENINPLDNSIRVKVNKNNFLDRIKKCLIIGVNQKDRENQIFFNINNNKIKMKTNENGIGIIKEEMEIYTDLKEEKSFICNGKYILEAVSCFPSEDIEIILSEEGSPIFFYGCNNQIKVNALVMPISRAEQE
jgi:DNA polymerase III sliding clamp (beta) subunit (PCNA family)